MKRFLLYLVLLCLVLILAGCGGSGSSGGQTAGALSLSVKWPARTRLIPVDSNSIVATLTDSTGKTIGTQTLVRPATTVSFTNLTPGQVTLSASAYPTTDGSGVAQATGSAPATITAGKNSQVTVTMADTIVKVTITPASPTVNVGASTTLTMTAYDAAGDVVLTSPTTTQWKSGTPADATIGSTGVLTGVLAGSSLITVTETESGVSGTTTATVAGTTTRNLKSPGWAVVNSTGTFLYAEVNEGVHVFSIGSNGQLTFVQEVAAPDLVNGFFPNMVLSNDGKHLYVSDGTIDSVTTPYIDVFTVNADGTLTYASHTQTTYIETMSIDGSGQYLFVATTAELEVLVFKIGANGALTQVTPAQILLATEVQGIPGTENFVGFANTQPNPTFKIMDLNGSGIVTTLGSLTYTVQNDSAGGFYYFNKAGTAVYNGAGTALFTFDVSNPASPTLANTLNLPGDAGAGAMTSDGSTLFLRLFYVGANRTSEIVPINLASMTIGTAQTNVPGESIEDVVLTPNGKYMYSPNTNANSISEFSVSGTTMTPLSPATVTG